MRQVLLLASVLVFLLIPAATDGKEEVLKSPPPPEFVFVSDVKAEMDLLVLKVPVKKLFPITKEVEVTKNGKTVKEKVLSSYKTVVEFTEVKSVLSRVRVTSAGGKEVPAADLAGLKGKAVLKAADESGVHDVYLKLLGKDAYVITPRPTKE